MQSVEKQHFNSCALCGSTHKIEFAEQIHKFRGRVPRNLYKGRKNVPARRGFSSKFDRKRGFDREAARKTLVFRQPQTAVHHTAVFLLFILLAGLGEIAASRAASPGVAGVLHKHGFSDRTERADVILLSHDNEPPLIRLLTVLLTFFLFFLITILV